MKLLSVLSLNRKFTGDDFLQRLCYQNNVRSKYLTFAIIIFGLLFASYDILILQKTLTFDVFLIHFKTDLVFLVLSCIFTLYIYFNQVRTYRDIHRHHKYIHGIISLTILIWTAFKSILFMQYNEGNYFLTFIGILTTGLVYIFPAIIHFTQLVTTILFAIITSLIFNFTLYQIAEDLYIVIIIALISFTVSRYIFHLQLKIYSKDKELLRYKRRITQPK